MTRSSCQPKHKVEYSMVLPEGGAGKITQSMTQTALAHLLLDSGITLISVNREPAVFYGRAKKKGR